MKLKEVAIIGTVGIPAKYGGFETLTEYLTLLLQDKVKFIVFCSSKSYSEKKATHNGAQLIYLPLQANGGQSILYDIVSLFKSAKIADTILILGTSGCIVLPLFRLFYPKKKLIINIDGLEHRRQKWNYTARNMLKISEKLAVKYATSIIVDNKGIQDYVFKTYGKNTILIAYGGNHVKNLNLTSETKLKLLIPDFYALKVCRIEPENNLHIVLEAFSKLKINLVIIGNWENNDYGKNLKLKYSGIKNILLLDSIYDQDILDEIRSNCAFYVHGHSAGGTNPSLVEAMFLGLPVICFDVIYNRETTLNQAIYFNTADELISIIQSLNQTALNKLGKKMKKIAEENYTWEKISGQYLKLFLD